MGDHSAIGPVWAIEGPIRTRTWTTTMAYPEEPDEMQELVDALNSGQTAFSSGLRDSVRLE